MRRIANIFVLSLALFGLGTNNSISAIINVPAGQPTIQAGIDAASASDTVIVASGTYTGAGNRRIDFGIKNIVLQSLSGPEATIIDCEGTELDPQYAFLINGQQDSTNIIDGFTITGCWDSTWSQAAVTVHNSTLYMRNCFLDSNVGGAIYVNGGSPDADFLILEDCRITNNKGGAAVYGHYLSVNITGTEVGFNSGDGMSVWQCHELILDNSIFHNNGGSGLWFTQMGQNCEITNCTFVMNQTGIVFDWDFPKGSGDLSDVRYLDSSGMANSIVAFNRTRGVVLAAPFYYYMNCNNVVGNPNGDWVGENYGTEYGNISYDPRFCDTSAADFTLQSGSACLPEHNSCGVLMGALDEGCEGPPPPRARLVPSEYPTIQDAIDSCSVDDTVMVAAGTYSGVGNRDLDFNGVNIILMSESGPDATIIDCEGTESEPHRCLTLQSGEDTTSIIQGLTFTNAYAATWGDAAVLIDGASARVRDCIFEDNNANGFAAMSAEVYISDCIARNNANNGFEVDGFYAEISRVEAYGNLNNGIFINGGGQFIIDSSVMHNNDHAGMFIHYFGGGFYVSNCTFVSNGYGLQYDWNYPKGTGIESASLLSDTAYIDNCIAAFNTFYGFTSSYMVIPHLTRCSDAFGNGSSDWNISFYDGLEYGAGDAYGNFSLNPYFCDTLSGDYSISSSSPCAPEISLCDLIGALDVGCQIDHDPRTWRVPGDRPTIQEAINTCLEGDTVLVAPGTYTGFGNVDLKFLGRNIVLTSEVGPQSTIIDCQGTSAEPHSGIKISRGEDTTSIIDGFTIQNSYGYSGSEGAITIVDASATVRNCNILTSYSNSLLCQNGMLNFYNCFVDSCTTNGVKLVACNAKIDGMTGTRLSHAVFWGGRAESLELTNSLMYNNRGFGISVFPITGTFNINSCTFVNNHTGIYLSQNISSPGGPTDTSYISNCISANHNQYGYYTWDGMNHPVIVTCNDAYGNGYQDWHLDPYGHGDAYGNLALDPLFCNTDAKDFNIKEESPCAPGNNSCGVLIGAGGIGCSCCIGITGNIDCDPTNVVDVGDLTVLIDYLFISNTPLCCVEEASTYHDGSIDIQDLTRLIDYLFISFTPPATCH